MKKFRLITLTLFIALLIPTSTFASTTGPQYGAGDWDTILGSNYEIATSTTKTTRVVNSGGGDARICITGINAGNGISFDLYSDNPYSDEQIQGFSFFNDAPSGTASRWCTGKIDVRPYKDGDYAELYLKMRSFYQLDTVYVEIED
ncbi:hypothetical protein VBD025_15285 [Virgibacillus flavescens]|uniref:hypothetical protein n=1 Tax=Virgibacillus flavescens TaxID=1611422 RepID=UPI003D330BC4